MDKLLKVQKELKAPKSQTNDFGKYKYRSAEDILEAVKPLCIDNGLLLTLSDTLECVGNRYYIKATATVTDAKSKEVVASVTAYAREEETKRGMDGAQITGSASSYARKYALNGLFCIDDTKDADTNEFKRQSDNKQSEPEPGKDFDPNEKIKSLDAKTLEGMIRSYGVAVEDVLKGYKLKSLEDMTKAQYANCIRTLDTQFGEKKGTIGTK